MTIASANRVLQNLALDDELGARFVLLAMGVVVLVAAHYYHNTYTRGYGLLLPFNVVTWMAISIWVSCTGLFVALRQRVYFSRTSKLLGLCCLLLSLPALYPNAEIDQVILRLLGLWMGLLLLISLQQFELSEAKLSLLLLLILGGVWVEVLRYWQAMINIYSVTGIFSNVEAYPFIGVFQSLNVMASFVATGLLLSVYLLSCYGRWRYGRFALPVMLLAPAFFIQILSAMASRTGWYGAAIGLALLAPFVLQRVDRRLLAVWIAMLALGFTVPWFLEYSAGWTATNKDIFSLVGARAILFPQSIAMFLSQPFSGFGYGTFESSYLAFMAERYAAGVPGSLAHHNTFHPHNEILFWAVEGGLIALVGICLAAWVVWRRVQRVELIHRLALIAICLPIALHSQLEFPFYASAVHWLIFVVLIFYIDATASASRLNLRCPTLPTALLSMVLAVSSIVFLSSTLVSGIALTRFNIGETEMDTIATLPDTLVWGDRASYAIYSTVLAYGIAESNPDYIREYIDWAPQIIAKQPRPIFFENLIIAHQALNQTDEANEVVREFRYLFPETEFTIAQVE